MEAVYYVLSVKPWNELKDDEARMAKSSKVPRRMALDWFGPKSQVKEVGMALRQWLKYEMNGEWGMGNIDVMIRFSIWFFLLRAWTYRLIHTNFLAALAYFR